MVPRRTIINAAVVSGRGLFTGRPARAKFVPGAGGIEFRRVDLEGAPSVPALVEHVAAAPAGIPARNTTLRRGSAEVLTVEHALSALAGLGITDVVVELDGPELPIGDGSGAMYAGALWGAGLRYLGSDVEALAPAREVVVTGENGARVVARPRAAPGCSYTYELDYGVGAVIAAQSCTFDTGRGDYRSEIAPARTFCTQAEAEAMQRAGLFRDFSARDLLVIGPGGPIENAYVFENEPARHKVLDLMGDLALAGRPIRADIRAYKSGHALNQRMARELSGG